MYKPRISIQEEKFEIKATKISAWKKAFFLGHPNSGSCVQNAETLLQNNFLLQNMSPDKWGGGSYKASPPAPPAPSVWQKAESLRVTQSLFRL